MKSSESKKVLANDKFLSVLNRFSISNTYWIAFSGGMDSSVLLHLFHTNKNNIKQNIEVVYVNHGLQSEADDWAAFCKQQCLQYEFPFTELRISENCPKGKSIEAWAREKRYALIEEKMDENDVLFTAHHQDDQVETFFLQAFRGSGPRGLASMPVVKEKSNRFHVRPLLDYSRADLKNYAEENNLNWQDDKSNSDNQYDRNYFRNQLAPLIEQKWPAYRNTISRLINNQNDCRHMLNELAEKDIKLAGYKNSLDLDVLKTLGSARQKNLLFFWLEELNLKIPGSRNIERIISDVIYSAMDKSPCVNWADVEVRRYRKRLYAFRVTDEYDYNIEYKWKPGESLKIFDEMLFAKSEKGNGISKNKVKDAEFVIRFRQGGESIRPHNTRHRKTVKQLFQERAVLPWLRDKVPLLYLNNDLVAIPGFCVDERYSAVENEASWNIHWSGLDEATQA